MARCGCSTCTRALEGVDVTYRSFLPVEPGHVLLRLVCRFAHALAGVYREGSLPDLAAPRSRAFDARAQRRLQSSRNFGRSLCFPIAEVESTFFANPQNSADLEGCHCRRGVLTVLDGKELSIDKGATLDVAGELVIEDGPYATALSVMAIACSVLTLPLVAYLIGV